MADLRVRNAVKLLNDADDILLLPDSIALTDTLSNPTTTRIGAANLVWTGSVWARSPGNTTGAIVQGSVAHDTPVNGLPLLLGGNASAAAQADVSADGDAVKAWFLRNGAQAVNLTAAGALIPGDATNGLDVDVIRVAGSGAVALADAVANPSLASVAGYMIGFNGTTWDRVRTANTGRLQVDVVTGGGAATPTNPVSTTVTSAAVAAGASANLDTADLGGETHSLWGVDITASVPWKAVVGGFENGASIETYATLFGRPGESYSWRPPHPNFASEAFSANAAFDGFRVVVTNLDNSQPADVYAQIHYAD